MRNSGLARRVWKVRRNRSDVLARAAGGLDEGRKGPDRERLGLGDARVGARRRRELGRQDVGLDRITGGVRRNQRGIPERPLPCAEIGPARGDLLTKVLVGIEDEGGHAEQDQGFGVRLRRIDDRRSVDAALPEPGAAVVALGPELGALPSSRSDLSSIATGLRMKVANRPKMNATTKAGRRKRQTDTPLARATTSSCSARQPDKGENRREQKREGQDLVDQERNSQERELERDEAVEAVLVAVGLQRPRCSCREAR